MNILFISEASWDTKNSYGNTISNLFEGSIWNEDHFYHFYTRNQPPCNNKNVDYYNLPPNKILKGALKFHIKGYRFSSDKINLQLFNSSEQDRINKFHKKPNNFIYFLHEILWLSRIWLNNDVKRFLLDSNPDVVFVFATPVFIIRPIIEYLEKKLSCKIVLYIVDDVYDQYLRTSWYRRLYLKSNFFCIAKHSSKIYAITQEMCDKYKDIIFKPVKLLRKGCDFNSNVKNTFALPLKIVYAGNLYWGRDEVLIHLVDAIKAINSNKEKFYLEIYSNNVLDDKQNVKLNVQGVSEFKGSRPSDEIANIMKSADIVLFVESFRKEYIDIVKYSFSTKIIDCLQSGNIPLAIGPSGISSIEYMKGIEGAFVIDNLNSLYDNLLNIIDNQSNLFECSRKVRAFAIDHHQRDKVQVMLRNDILDAIN